MNGKDRKGEQGEGSNVIVGGEIKRGMIDATLGLGCERRKSTKAGISFGYTNYRDDDWLDTPLSTLSVICS